MFEVAVHRPLPYLLVGFTEADRKLAQRQMREAVRYIMKRLKGIDGLTDRDREFVEIARQSEDWREIARMASVTDTAMGRDILRRELQRAMDNELRRRRMYND